MVCDPKKLSIYAKRFRDQDPAVYEQFIRLLDQYVSELTVAVTEAPSSDVLVAQGRAQQARKFFQILTELPQ